MSASIALAPPSAADPIAAFQSEVASLRGQTSCPPLRYNAVVEQAADYINQSTDQYLDRTARQVPITDPLPLLNDLGYTPSKAKLMQGVAPTDAESMQGTILQARAYDVISDCGYRDFGVSRRQNQTSGLILTAMLFAAL
ncbi:hypothetical protein [Mycolicibacterium septicum]|uniref:hypothetical protein n=1 Tax=Mycolicibacterium septicum TaxID=98668 RepID=UPI00236148FE|nr:hypothetical protein [Mycolicibacterium septicum]